jgi:hypothetical protein
VIALSPKLPEITSNLVWNKARETESSWMEAADRPNSVIDRCRNHIEDPKIAGHFGFWEGEATMYLKSAIVAALCASTPVSSPGFGQGRNSEHCLPPFFY